MVKLMVQPQQETDCHYQDYAASRENGKHRLLWSTAKCAVNPLHRIIAICWNSTRVEYYAHVMHARCSLVTQDRVGESIVLYLGAIWYCRIFR